MGNGNSKVKNGRRQSSSSPGDKEDIPTQSSTSVSSVSDAVSSQKHTTATPPSPPISAPNASSPSIPSSTTDLASSHSKSLPILVGSPHINTSNLNVNKASSGSLASPRSAEDMLTPASPSQFAGFIGRMGSTNVGEDKYDIDDIIARLREARYQKSSKSVCLKNSEISFVCQKAREVFMEQPVLLELNPPVNIVGDIHGQYDDLLRIFDLTGYPPNANYLFLGDYVDRGKQSLETILLLMCYKVKYPENFFILRGNHECASVNRVYGFYDECKRRCSLKVWKMFTDVFNCLPIAALVAGKIFCVHGGLSPSMSAMDDIRQISRPCDVPDFGLLNDLLWSDPSEVANDWEDNERGVSYCFGKQIVSDFLSKYDLDLVCRAHMVVEEGYEFFNDRTLVTIFSAPNYCGEFDNKGAVMSVNDDLLCSFEILQPSSNVRSGIKGKRRVSPPLLK